ncbi:GNAT family N-acetyltransferase [Palleronia sp. KMU-117]|uniref:GNAT family N-acetyltransferase n=1 Tax=Palleronia sp. KMU-117 TaxID=3434108 RepID=UPI003D74F606
MAAPTPADAPWLRPVPEAATLRGALARAVPVIETERLRLRAPRVEDWPALEESWTSARAVYLGGPFTPEEGWSDFCRMVAGWLLRGVGYFTVERRESGEVLGFVGINHDWGDAELEEGWQVTAEAEGKGYATEAARAVRDWAFTTLGLRGFVSYVDPANARSQALARRIGGVLDPEAPLTGPNDDGHTIVFRHRAEGIAR